MASVAEAALCAGEVISSRLTNAGSFCAIKLRSGTAVRMVSSAGCLHRRDALECQVLLPKAELAMPASAQFT